MTEDEPSTIDEATEPAIDESPFAEDSETTVEKELPSAREDATVPTVTEPLPIGYGQEEEESTAVVARFDPPTVVELHAPVMGPEERNGPDQPSFPLIGAIAILTVTLVGCLVAVIFL